MVTLLFLLSLFTLLGGIGVSVINSIKASEGKTVVKPVPALAGLAVSALFFSLYLGAYSVDAGSIGVVKRFGRPVGMLQPGLHFVRPIGDTVTEVAVQRRITKVSEAASSSDLQIVNVEVTLGYHIDPAYADFALIQLNNDAEERVIRPANLEAIKARTAQFEVQGLVKQRELVRAGIEQDVRARLASQHIVLEDMAITNFSFSAAYESAIEAKQVAEQNAEKQRNLLETTKIEAEQAQAKAKGEADARRAQAEGEAAAILVEAQAKAKAQELQRASLTPELLELRRIEMFNNKWDGQLPQMVTGGGTLLQLPVPAGKSKPQAEKE
jgi:regulator of protease activity HflC (stomatin/prohibitin superfamily)